MGLEPLRGGAATTLVQQRTDGAGQRDERLPTHYRKTRRGCYTPAADLYDWRFLAGHGHGEIRRVARNGLLVTIGDDGRRTPEAPARDYQFVPHADHLPVVRCTLFGADDRPSPRSFAGVRGVYLARFAEKSYVGQTDELHVRWRQQVSKGAVRVIFVRPDGDDLALDVLLAAEGLSIAALAELLQLANGKYGKDREPARPFLRQASAFALVFEAAIVKLAVAGLATDVMCWRAERDVRGLRDAYLRLDS